jgi:hypothetical protein
VAEGQDATATSVSQSANFARLVGQLGDAKLRARTAMILRMTVDERLCQLEAEANFFGSVRPRRD